MLHLKNKKIYLAVVASAFLGFFSPCKASAISATDDQLHETAIMIGVEQCYRDYVKSEVKKSDFDTFGWGQIFDTSTKVGGYKYGSDGKVIIPTQIGNTISDNDLSCSETFNGYDGVGGKAKGFTGYASMPNNLDDLGFVFDHAGTGGSSSSQVTVKLDSVSDATGNNTHNATIEGSIVVSGEKSKSGSHWKWTITSVTGTLTAKYVYGDINDTVYTIMYPGNYQHIGVQSTPFDGQYAAYFPWNDEALGYAVRGDVSGSNQGSSESYSLADMLNEKYIPELKENIEIAFQYDTNTYTDAVASISVTDTTPTSTDPDNAESIYVPVSFGSSPGQNMKYNANAGADIPYLTTNFSGRTGWSHYYPKNYIYALYYKYLALVQEEYPSISIDNNCPTTKPTSGHYFKNSETTWCQITIPNDASPSLSKSLAIVNSGILEMGTFSDILTWFESEDSYSGLAPEDYANLDPSNPSITSTTSGSGEDDQEDSEEAKCYQNAKSLGWVICPIIYGLRDMTEHFYEAIEPLLATNDSIVGQLGSTDSGLYKSWLAFRNIANIIFVILFLFIIFSQLTGWGIDNYGIKKMLPKLILVAILVNLSYIICAIAVDVSNIVGHGIKGMLESMGTATGADLGGDSVHAFGTFAQKAVAFIAVAGTTAVAAYAAFALEGWALIIPILLFLLTIVISIFFALVILGVRQALVVILIVVSPVAFACSLLPNTESIFKKWFSAAKGILMVYPIVGAVIGAGYLTASILMSSDQGFIMTLVSGILMVVPYFMIPSLTRKALDAVGNIGSKISGFGKGLSTGAKNRINSTDAVRNAKADSTAQRAQSRAARYMNSDRARKVEEDIKNGKKVSMRRANKYQRAAGLANADRQSVINARGAQSQYNRLQSDSGFQAAMSAANMAEDATAVKNFETMISAGDFKLGDGTKLDSQNNEAIAAALQHELTQTGANYDANKVRALTNALAAKGKEGRNLMYSAVNGAQQAGASRQAIKDFSSNIMNNHAGTMKEKHRSLYEFAKATAGLDASAAGSADSISNFAASGVGSLTAADMTNMDIQQLQRYRENVSGNDTQTLAQLAQSALSDEHLSKDLSEKTRTELEKIAQQGGYTPPAHSSNGGLSGDSGKIHTAAAQDSQQLTATQAAAQIQNAVNNNRSVASTDPLVQKAEQDALNAIKSGAADAAPKNVILGPDGKPLSRK